MNPGLTTLVHDDGSETHGQGIISCHPPDEMLGGSPHAAFGTLVEHRQGMVAWAMPATQRHRGMVRHSTTTGTYKVVNDGLFHYRCRKEISGRTRPKDICTYDVFPELVRPLTPTLFIA